MKFNRLNDYARLMVLSAAALAVPMVSAPAYAEPVPQAAPSDATISGVVLDDIGEPAIGVSVKCKENPALSVATDIDGNFTVRSSKPVTLEISYIGYQPQMVKAEPGKPLTIHLKAGTNVLDDIVVVGFATQKKVNLTGSVGTASAKDIASRPVQNAAAALQGVIPGLNISNSTAGGELNSSKQVNVRGTATIGAGSSGGPLILIDGLEGDLNSINPNDIESISVLKDAAASSIYGSRAPFGVILITTKSGSNGKSQIRYSNSFRFNQPLTPLKIMDSWEYLNYLNDVTAYTSPGSIKFSEDFMNQAYAYYTGESDNFIYENSWRGTSRIWGKGLDSNSTFANVNWVDELYKKTAFAQEHNVTLSGGNEKTSYYVSGNFLDQNGFMRYGNDSYERYSLMGKFSAQMFSWLNVQYTGRWMRTDYSRPTYMNGGFYEKVLRRMPAIIPKYDPNGYIASDYNYIDFLENGGRHKEQNDIFTNQLKLVITPLKGWNIIGELNTRVNSDWTHWDSKVIYAHDADDLEGLSHESVHVASDSGEHDKVYEYSGRTTYLNYNIYTDYTFNVAEKNNFKAMIGFQAEDNKYRKLNAEREDMIVTDLPVLDLTTSDEKYAIGGKYDKWRTCGFFGRINYDYDSKYLLEFNLRYDGSSRFRSYHRWVWSPSFSAGWNIDRENFWEKIRPVVPSLKFRVSYGQLANQNTTSPYPTYRTVDTYTNGSSWLVNGALQNTANFPALIDPDLTWEKIRNTNIGIDFALFRYRLSGSFDYYWRTNHDMIGPPVKYPAVFGANVPSENSLSLRTQGWELQLNWQDNIGDFNYAVKFNLSDDKAKVLEYPNAERLFDTNQLDNVKYCAGEYIGNIYGFESLGVARDDEQMAAHLATTDQSQIGSNWMGGDIMYKDLDGDGVITKGNGLDNMGDLKKLGNHQPRYRVGLNLFAQWKGIDVTAFFQGVLKRDYYFCPYGGQGTNGKGAVFWGATVGGENESIFLKEHLDYWRDENSVLGENRDAYYARPLYYTNKNREFQDRYMQNASYLRLKNLQVGYTFPREWTKKWFCDNFRVFFSAENLCTWTKLSKVLDPESLEVSNMKSGASYPIAKTYSFGLTIDF